MGSTDRQLTASSTALVVIDMQNDFCSNGYYMDQAGYDVARLRRPVAPIQHVLAAARRSSTSVVFTRQYRPLDSREGQADHPYPRLALKGEPGWEIIPELAPGAAEEVIDKIACSAFVSTNMQELLQRKNARTLVFCGNTIDVCVHSTLRSANDLGYQCITLADCCGAVNDELHRWSLESIKVENGVFGQVMDSAEFIGLLQTQPGR
jgi:nicotinamidase-related amidase